MSKKNKIVCLGDGIATDCALRVKANTFAELLGRRLGMEVSNHARLSATCSGTYELILNDSEVQDDLARAGIVIVMLGVNDLIINSGAMETMAEAVGIAEDERTPEAVIAAFKDDPLNGSKMIKALNAAAARERIKEASDAFKETYPGLITEIRKLNEKAIILIPTVYTFTDISRSPLYKVTTKTLTDIANEVNGFLKVTYDQSGNIVVDLAQALRDYCGKEELSNLIDNDFHLSDSGHIFTYELLYETLSGAYPEYVCAPTGEVILKSRDTSPKEIYTGSSRFSNELKELIEAIMSRRIPDYDEKKQFIAMNINAVYVNDISLEIERRYFEGQKRIELPGSSAVYISPVYFLAYLEGKEKPSIITHVADLAHYASKEEKQAQEEADSMIMRVLKKSIYDYLKDDMVRIDRDSTYFGSLDMNYIDWHNCMFKTEMDLDMSLAFAKTPDPETVTLGAIEDYVNSKK